MEIYEVLSTMKINKDTAIVVKNKGIDFKHGIGILDDNGKPHKVKSVGITSRNLDCKPYDTIDLLIEGELVTKKIFV